MNIGPYVNLTLRAVREKLIVEKQKLKESIEKQKRDYVNWESSTLRAWLNGDFYSNAFNETEKPNLIGMGETASLVDSNVEFVDKVSILSSSSVSMIIRHSSFAIFICFIFSKVYSFVASSSRILFDK